MKTVLVTGASSGMGKATAERLLGEGYTVYAAARRLEQMRDLESLGATILRMDITLDDDIVAVVDRISSEKGGIDILVNNAGFGVYGAMEDVAIADAKAQFEVNLFGLARLTQLALPHMRQRKSGKIVNVSSMGGKIYTPMGGWYHASKFALEGWSDCLRFELKPFGIDVIVVEPGVIETEFDDAMIGPLLERSGDGPYGKMARSTAESYRRNYTPGRASPPELIADMIARAISARRPKTRYAAGKLARPLIMVRKFTSDRLFDRLLSLAF